MSLEELLRSRVIRRIRPDNRLALNAISRSKRDIDTAMTLIANKKFNWSLAVAYNAMLGAARAYIRLREVSDHPAVKDMLLLLGLCKLRLRMKQATERY